MSQPLFTFRQLPTVAEMLAERGVAIGDVMRAAGFVETSPVEITAPLTKVQKLLDLAAEKAGSPCSVSTSRTASRRALMGSPSSSFARR